jgi:hypothetical protein
LTLFEINDQANIHQNCAPAQQTGYTPSNRPGIFENPSAGAATGMGRLEALVAVATSEGKSAARLF